MDKSVIKEKKSTRNNLVMFLRAENEKQAKQLNIANKKLILQYKEKEKRNLQLISANAKLHAAEEFQKEYISKLEELIFITSHKVRQPVTNILGISFLMDQDLTSPEDAEQFISYIKESTIVLDDCTKELTILIHSLKQMKKLKIKNYISF